MKEVTIRYIRNHPGKTFCGVRRFYQGDTYNGYVYETVMYVGYDENGCTANLIRIDAKGDTHTAHGYDSYYKY